MPTFGQLVRCLPDGQSQIFALSKSGITLGRASTNDVVVNDRNISRLHARLDCDAGGCRIMDLGSANGTFVNGLRVSSARLAAGDVVRIGLDTLRFEPAAQGDQAPDEADAIAINSEADLEITLRRNSLTTQLSDLSMPRLAVQSGGRIWEAPLLGDHLNIGRDAANAVALDDDEASRRHAVVERRGDGFVLRDLDSSNGTWVGRQRVTECVLADGDTILIGNARIVFKSGAALDETFSSRRQSVARRPVVFVPGALGSELWRGSERIFPNVKTLFTQPELLAMPCAHRLEARSPVNEVVVVPNLMKLEAYGRLSSFLEEELGYERGRDLFEFTYDWRQDNRISARRLAAAIERWGITQPFTIIAHSMGSLVSRYYLECLGGKKQVARAVFLGGPHYGAPEAMTTLLYGPDFMPFGKLGQRLRRVMATFPSIYQLLPIYPCVSNYQGRAINPLLDESWANEEQRPLLRAAREFRRELGQTVSVPSISIFGYGQKTITQTTLCHDTRGRWQKADFISSRAGDATVPEASAILQSSEIHPVAQMHGSLYVDGDVRKRLKLELTR